MIFRTIVAVGLIGLLMPKEPDLGFGRPGPSVVQLIAQLGVNFGALGVVNGGARDQSGSVLLADDESGRASIMGRLQAVKIDIELDRNRRAARTAARDQGGESLR
jgi:hypothetical protein